MAEINIYKNPPPKIRPGQDLDVKHWSEGYWIWVEEEDWEWNDDEQVWEYAEGYWEFIEGNYWIYVESSNVRAIRYDNNASELYVWFDSGRIYKYSQVPIPVAESMFSADSLGKYVHERLIGQFGVSRVK